MKLDPRALSLVRLCNGRPVPTFGEILEAYRLAIRLFANDDAVKDVLSVWLSGHERSFHAVARNYQTALKTVEEMDHDFGELLEEIPPEPARPPIVPIPVPLKSKGPIPRLNTGRLTTPYLSGANRS